MSRGPLNRCPSLLVLAVLGGWLHCVPSASAAPAAADAGSAEVHSGALRIKVTALTDDVLRVTVAPRGEYPEDASWAVLAAQRHRAAAVQTLSTPADAPATAAEFRTATLQVRLEATPLRLRVSDLAGHVVSADSPEHAVGVDGDAFTLRKVMPPSEHYFALGDKTGPLDHRGQSFVNWNTDAYHFQESTDPIYKSIPFFIAAGGPGGSYGILLDNTWRTWFDFGHREPDAVAFGSTGGPIDYYLIYGPSTRQVVERYHELTGHAPLPPLWAFGFQQSKYSYLSAAEVEGIAARLRAERIPADVIWLDIDYQERNRPFTTNPDTYPDLAGLAARLRRVGIRLVAITDMHIAAAPDQNYAPYTSGMAGDHFIKAADGSLFIGSVWPGPAVFPDFTQSGTRDWWGGLYRGFLDDGIAGFWNDMNEPALFQTPTKTMPLDNIHRIAEPGFAPRSATHAEIHNVYGMQNSRATFDGLTRLRPDERPFVLTRASYAGGQRYAATWTGDNSSTWNHLKLSIPMLLNLGLSGFGYSGTDVGGFIGTPTADLYTRWIEIAAFTPIFRVHSEKGAPPKEPWVHGPRHTDIRRRYIEQRYRLLPYLYALADENSRTGAPPMRPVFYEFPQALEAACDQSNTFMLGADLLIVPPPDLESPAAYEVCLPPGHWYDFWSGAPVRATPAKSMPPAPPRSELVLHVTPTLDRLPVYVRAGAILPTQPLVQSTAETPVGPLILDVFPGADCHGVLYADDGHSMRYALRGFRRQSVRCAVTTQGLDLNFEPREGDFDAWWRRITLRVHGWRGAAHARLNGAPIADPAPARNGTLTVTVADSSDLRQVSLRRP